MDNRAHLVDGLRTVGRHLSIKNIVVKPEHDLPEIGYYRGDHKRLLILDDLLLYQKYPLRRNKSCLKIGTVLFSPIIKYSLPRKKNRPLLIRLVEKCAVPARLYITTDHN